MAFDFANDNQDWFEMSNYSSNIFAQHDYPDKDGAIFFDVYDTEDCEDSDPSDYRYTKLFRLVNDFFFGVIDPAPGWQDIIGFRFDINLNEYMTTDLSVIDIQPFIEVAVPNDEGNPEYNLGNPYTVYGPMFSQGKARRSGDFYTYKYLINTSDVPPGSVLVSIGVKVLFNSCPRNSGKVYLDNVEPVYSMWEKINPELIKFSRDLEDLEMFYLDDK